MGTEDRIINERIDKEISDREQACIDLQNRMDCQNDDKARELEELRERMMKENMFLNAINHKTMSVYFDAFRSKAYDGGGEENLTFNGGQYFFMFHIATHDNKKALLSIRKNGEEVASIFDQNHKDNHKNSMAGQSIVIDCIRGDEIVIYAYTGTWLADFPMNHYTHWVGILLKPDENEYNMIRKSVEEGVDPTAPVPCQPDNDYE